MEIFLQKQLIFVRMTCQSRLKVWQIILRIKTWRDKWHDIPWGHEQPLKFFLLEGVIFSANKTFFVYACHA